jgi:excisionase family DNA binding protein
MGLLTTQEIARQLQCSASTVRRLTRSGQIPHHKIGRLVRYPADAVELALKSETFVSDKKK